MLFSHEHFTLLPDEPHVDPDISADTRVKVNIRLFLEKSLTASVCSA